MFEILDMVHGILEEQKITAEEQLQLNKICDLEDKFVKEFSKDKWKEYFDLDIEKGELKFDDIVFQVQIFGFFMQESMHFRPGCA